MFSIIKSVKEVLPENNLTYVMGIGSPLEILGAVESGADCFDSAYPTRMARHGKIFTSKGSIEIDHSSQRNSFSSLDENCDCFVCKKYSKAYLAHLFRTHEQNGAMLLSYHNTFFITNLMKNIRLAIKEGNFNKFKKEFELNYKVKKAKIAKPEVKKQEIIN